MTLFRLILETAGLGWVAPSHQNDRGSHATKVTDIPRIFGQSSSKVIRGIIERYKMDFKICGYEQSLQQLISMADLAEDREEMMKPIPDIPTVFSS